eukprot:763499-Hanusia_phi.AAC.3
MEMMRILATLLFGLALLVGTVRHLEGTVEGSELLGWRAVVGAGAPMDMRREVEMVPAQDVTFVVRNADPREAKSISGLFDQGYDANNEGPVTVSYELPSSSSRMLLPEGYEAEAVQVGGERDQPPFAGPALVSSTQEPTFEISGELEPVGDASEAEPETRRMSVKVVPQLAEHAAKVKLEALARIVKRSQKSSMGKGASGELEEKRGEEEGEKERMLQMVEANKKSVTDLTIAMERQKLVNAGEYKLLYRKLERVRQALHALQLSSSSATSQLKRELLHAQALISRGKSMLAERRRRVEAASSVRGEVSATELTPECAKAQVFCSPAVSAQKLSASRGSAWRGLGGLSKVGGGGRGEQEAARSSRVQDQDPETLFSGYHLAGGRHPGRDLDKAREQFLLHSMRTKETGSDPLQQRRIAISQSLLRTAEGGSREAAGEEGERTKVADASARADEVCARPVVCPLSLTDLCREGEEKGDGREEERRGGERRWPEQEVGVSRQELEQREVSNELWPRRR